MFAIMLSTEAVATGIDKQMFARGNIAMSMLFMVDPSVVLSCPPWAVERCICDTFSIPK